MERRQREEGLAVAGDICWDFTIRGDQILSLVLSPA
jgi:hypothetical protein